MDGRRQAGRRLGELAAVPVTRQKKRYIEEEQPAMELRAGQHTPRYAASGAYRGVHWRAPASKWEAQICDKGKQRFLGYFHTEVEAARMYDAAASKLQGAAAKLNFPSKSSAGGATGEALSRLLSPLQKGTSQFRGVSWNQASNKWRAQLCHGETVHHLGYFESEVEAAHEYDRAALRLKGCSAATNFPAAEYPEDGSPMEVSAAGAAQPESQFLGVTWDTVAAKWVAELWDGQRYKLIGTFEAEQDAAAAYDSACRKMYGMQAIVNFASAPAKPIQGGKDADLELAAMEALASMSSSFDDGTHFDISPPGMTKDQQAASPKQNFPAVRRETPEAMAVNLQPTPSPYQGSNCDNSHPADPHQMEAAGRLSVVADAVVPGRPAAQETGKSSRYKGVSWHKHTQKWYAYIAHGGRMRGLGYFLTQQEAAAAYDAEALKIHGSKAVLNLPHGEKSMSAPPSSGTGPVTRAATAPQDAKQTHLREGIKWNPTDQLYHVLIWDKQAGCLRSCGGFKSKAAAVSALHRDGDSLLGQARLQSSSDAAAGTAQLSRCNSFAGGSGTVSPFSRPAWQRSDTVDGSQLQSTNLERASSINSPLKPHAALAKAPAHQAEVPPQEAFRPMPSIPAGRPRRAGLRQRPQDSDDSCSGIVGNSWGQATDLEMPGALDGQEGGSAAVKEDDGVPSSRSTSPLPQSQGRKRARAAARPSRQPFRGSSKYKGVSWSERSCKWRAQMWFGNKVHHLGFFDTEEAAARCYDAAVLQLRGPAAATNFQPSERAGKENPLKPSVLQNLTSASLPKVTSQYRGVRWHYCNSKWEARIFDGQRQISLGYFDEEADAAAAYDERARGLRGMAAVVNFPDRASGQPELPPPAAKLPPRRASSVRKREHDDDDYLPEPPSRWGSTRRRQ